MKLIRLQNNDTKIDISSIGAAIVNFLTKDKNGQEINIALGYDNEDQYLTNSTYFGAVVGPIANRIDMGCYTLDGVTHQLTQNNGTNHLHGGAAELNNRHWQVNESSDTSVSLMTQVQKGEGGYPCDIAISVIYSLNEHNELKIHYTATPQARCPINLTQHVYFNLNGSSNILDHALRIEADEFLPVNDKLIPTGSQDVSNTPFDFRKPTIIGDAITQEHAQIAIAGGFDHCWVLNHQDYSMDVFSETSGIRLQAKTDLPGVQFYSGNFIDAEPGRNGSTYTHNAGLCLETQYFPNQANMDNAENCVFDLSRPFVSETVYKVSVD